MTLRIPVVGTLALLLSACATSKPATRSARDDLPPPAREGRAGAKVPGAGPVAPSAERPLTGPQHDEAVQRAIATARGLLGQREILVEGSRYGDDCAALVRAALVRAGTALPGDATTAARLHAVARDRALLRRGAPSPGDVLFLSDRPGGPPAHVGIVELVSDDGTATVLHRTDRGVARLRVNAAHPWTLRNDAGRYLNDPLVTGGGRIPAGRLFVAWAALY
jgi:hypothetical protein